MRNASVKQRKDEVVEDRFRRQKLSRQSQNSRGIVTKKDVDIHLPSLLADTL
jgi:hypothetical protein